MRRTARGVVAARGVLGSLVLAGVVSLTGAGAAVADTAPKPVPSVSDVPSAEPSTGASAVPSTMPSDGGSSMAPTKAPSEATPVPSAGTGRQVGVVPRGAAETGVGEESSDSGLSATKLAGIGAGGALLAGGVFFLVRGRRATGE